MHGPTLHCVDPFGLRCIAQRCVMPRCTQLQCASLHCSTRDCTALRCSAALPCAVRCPDRTERSAAQRCLDMPCIAPQRTALSRSAVPLPHYHALRCIALRCVALRCIPPHCIAPPPSALPSPPPLGKPHPIRIACRLSPAPSRPLRSLIGCQHLHGSCLHGDAVERQPKMAAEPGGGCRGFLARPLLAALAALAAALLLGCGRAAGLSPSFSSSSCRHRVPGGGEVRPRGSSGGAGR